MRIYIARPQPLCDAMRDKVIIGYDDDEVADDCDVHWNGFLGASENTYFVSIYTCDALKK